MATRPSTTSKRGRGRPRADGKTSVVAKLIEAAETLLRECHHHELSERKIAAAAGTNEAMIHYYFGGKDGLLFEVMLRYYDDVIDKLKALETVDPRSPTATRDMFKIMKDAYYEKHWIARMVIAEFARGSSVFKDMYLERFGSQGVGLVRLRRTIERLVESGIYDRNVNIDYIGISMFSMIIGPFLMAPFSRNPDFERVLNQQEWVDFASDLFDRQLRGRHDD